MGQRRGPAWGSCSAPAPAVGGARGRGLSHAGRGQCSGGVAKRSRGVALRPLLSRAGRGRGPAGRAWQRPGACAGGRAVRMTAGCS